MKNIQATSAIVKQVLEESPETRNSDSLLYIKVIEHINKTLIYKPLADVLQNRKEYGIPPFESVRRSRQKIQSCFPNLAAKKEVAAARAENEVIVRDFARG